MPTDRAYTWVGSGETRAGNRWLERRWSRFLGHTTELATANGRIEWLREACREFEFTVDGVIHRLMDFGEISFSERCDAHTAVLEMQLTGGQMGLLSEVFVFHAWPGMLRRWWILNRSAGILSLEGGRLEWLSTRWEAEREGSRLILQRGGSGLILFASQESCWNTVGVREYALDIRATGELAGGGKVLLEQTGILGFEQGLEEALGTELPHFMEMLRKYEEEQQASARLRRREYLRAEAIESQTNGGA